MVRALRELFGDIVEAHGVVPDLITIRVEGPIERERGEKGVMVDVGCAEAVLRGADVFVPGVLASTSSCDSHTVHPGESLSLYYSPTPLLRGSKLPSVPPDSLFLGNGLAQLNRSDVFTVSQGVAVKVNQGVYQSPALNGVFPERLFQQYLPSAVAGHVLGVSGRQPTEQDIVLDMCAAPGGKTTHLSTLMHNSGTLIALERSEKRCAELRRNLALWGATNVQVRKMDASKAANSLGEGQFSKILLDAPCSCLGQRPQLASRPVDVPSTASFQRRLLTEASILLQPGGQLVYSTCTITPEGTLT